MEAKKPQVLKIQPANAKFIFSDGNEEFVVDYRFRKGKHWLVVVTWRGQSVRLDNANGTYKARVVDSVRAIEAADMALKTGGRKVAPAAYRRADARREATVRQTGARSLKLYHDDEK